MDLDYIDTMLQQQVISNNRITDTNDLLLYTRGKFVCNDDKIHYHLLFLDSEGIIKFTRSISTIDNNALKLIVNALKDSINKCHNKVVNKLLVIVSFNKNNKEKIFLSGQDKTRIQTIRKLIDEHNLMFADYLKFDSQYTCSASANHYLYAINK